MKTAIVENRAARNYHLSAGRSSNSSETSPDAAPDNDESTAKTLGGIILNPEEYGDKYSDHLIEQYKLYVEMADRVSQRRDQSNRFYVALLGALAAILVIAARFVLSDDGESSMFMTAVFLTSGVFGAILSIIWYLNIRSYRTLNSAKFAIIHEMEKEIPFAGYAKEWEILRPPDGSPKYLQLTAVEQFVPILVFLTFAALAGYSAFLLFR